MDRPDITMMLVVHNAFRRDLARMQAAAAQGDDPAARTALRAGWATFSRYLTIHHTAEDEMLWPPMRAKLLDRSNETDLLVGMADEHSRLDPVLREIDDNLAQGASSRLVPLFDELATVLTGHLDHEEAAALPLVQEILTSREWQAFGDDQRRRIGVNGAGWFFPWLLDDTSQATKDKVLDLVPPPLRLVYQVIWEPRYRRKSPWRREPSTRR
ncbi:hemerythrin domain-containing protein [Nocardia sp. CA-119907]|uniref:hemerythrin domain-containing protein n=1 Tax=Nocardia sp. CA-119907 TaxID=3239973 RepID=UPI003D9931D1